MNGLEQLLPFVLIALVFWLLLIRPQRRRQQELMRTQKALEIGDEVLLSAGIVAHVASLGDEYLHVEVSPGVQMKVARQAIIRVVQPEEQPLDDRIVDESDRPGIDGPDAPGGPDDRPSDVPDDRPPSDR